MNAMQPHKCLGERRQKAQKYIVLMIEGEEAGGRGVFGVKQYSVAEEYHKR